VRIRRTQNLRAHVAHAHGLHHRAHRATRDHARSFRRRLHQHTTRAVLPNQLVRQRVIDQRHANQVLLRRLDAFLDRERNFSRLTRAETNVSTFIADHDERRERKVLAALDDLGHTIDGDDLIFEVEPLRGDAYFRLSHILFFAFLA
jgi:hypothetical protein